MVSVFSLQSFPPWVASVLPGEAEPLRHENHMFSDQQWRLGLGENRHTLDPVWGPPSYSKESLQPHGLGLLTSLLTDSQGHGAYCVSAISISHLENVDLNWVFHADHYVWLN